MYKISTKNMTCDSRVTIQYTDMHYETLRSVNIMKYIFNNFYNERGQEIFVHTLSNRSPRSILII